MIGTFPAMSPMADVARDELGALLTGLEPYSDFTFGSLRYWDTGDRLRLCTHAGNLIVRFYDYLTGEPCFGLAGSGDVAASARTLADELGVRELSLVPAPVAEALAAEGWVVEPDRDNFDYVVDLQEWMTLSGRRHRGRRRALNAFEARHGAGEWEVTRVDDWRLAQDAMTQIRSEWALHHPDRAETAHEEAEALDRLMKIGHEDTAIGVFVLWVKDAPVAFEVHEPLERGWGVAHFGKSAGHSPEDETVLEVLAGRQLLMDHRVRWLNVEQDLGLPGLRERKLHHGPSRMLEKFTATLT